MGKVELLENASKRYENQSKFKKKYTKFKLKDCSTWYDNLFYHFTTLSA